MSVNFPEEFCFFMQSFKSEVMKSKYVNLVRIVLGLVFVFSGFVKAVDPLGTAYKLQDYSGALGIPALSQFALFFAVVLIAVEFVTGLMLVFNVFPRAGLWLATGLMIVFTPLTLYLALTNAVSDCGCFGDALKMTNWQTFWKDIAIDALVVLLWLWRKDLNRQEIKDKRRLYAVIVFVVLVFGFEAYNLMFLPVIDFRPYKTGVDIKQALDHGRDSVIYETVLVYRNKKTGELKEFSEDNYPWQDTVNWQWVDTKVREIRKASKTSGIHDFYFNTLDGTDITNQLLSTQKPVIIIVANDLKKANVRGFRKILQFYKENKDKFYPVIYCATASPEQQVISFLQDNCDLKSIVFLSSDATMLKTIVRANPGVLILYNGVIVGKESWRSLKRQEEIGK